MLTTRISPQDELSDLIIDKDEETVGEGTEPPGRSGREPGASLMECTQPPWTQTPAVRAEGVSQDGGITQD